MDDLPDSFCPIRHVMLSDDNLHHPVSIIDLKFFILKAEKIIVISIFAIVVSLFDYF